MATVKRSLPYPKKRYVRYARSLRRAACSPRTLLDVLFDIATALQFKGSASPSGLSRRRQYTKQPRLSVEAVIAHGRGALKNAASRLQRWIDWFAGFASEQAVRGFVVGFAAAFLLA